jgi:hypothetical protein
MEQYDVFPNPPIVNRDVISKKFRSLGITTFWNACEYVHRLPYGYNSNRDDIMILFKEGYGTCSTKHAVIAVLAEELAIPVVRMFGIYAMKEDLVTGADHILVKFKLPYVPMIHCFLAYGFHWVDLTEGNDNGKNHPIKDFIYTKKVVSNLSEKSEYLIYRTALVNHILPREETKDLELSNVLRARSEGVALLKSKLVHNLKTSSRSQTHGLKKGY